VNLESMGRQGVIDFFLNRVPVFRPQLEEALAAVGPVSSWPETPGGAIEDSGEPFPLEPGCTKKVAATRIDNQIFIVASVAKHLSEAQLGLLNVHEALFYLAEKAGHTNSVGVRSVVKEFLQRVPNVRIQLDALHKIGGKAFVFEWMRRDTGSFAGYAYEGNRQMVVRSHISFGAAGWFEHSVIQDRFPLDGLYDDDNGMSSSVIAEYRFAYCRGDGRECALKDFRLLVDHQARTYILLRGCQVTFDANATVIAMACADHQRRQGQTPDGPSPGWDPDAPGLGAWQGKFIRQD
jgi:hypothetical protein